MPHCASSSLLPTQRYSTSLMHQFLLSSINCHHRQKQRQLQMREVLNQLTKAVGPSKMAPPAINRLLLRPVLASRFHRRERSFSKLVSNCKRIHRSTLIGLLSSELSILVYNASGSSDTMYMLPCRSMLPLPALAHSGILALIPSLSGSYASVSIQYLAAPCQAKVI